MRASPYSLQCLNYFPEQTVFFYKYEHFNTIIDVSVYQRPYFFRVCWGDIEAKECCDYSLTSENGEFSEVVLKQRLAPTLLWLHRMENSLKMWRSKGSLRPFFDFREWREGVLKQRFSATTRWRQRLRNPLETSCDEQARIFCMS